MHLLSIVKYCDACHPAEEKFSRGKQARASKFLLECCFLEKLASVKGECLHFKEQGRSKNASTLRCRLFNGVGQV